METLLTRVRCGCTFDAHGALVDRCAGHNNVVPLQKGRRFPAEGEPEIVTPSVDRSSQMLAWVLEAIIILGCFASGWALRALMHR